MAEHPEGVVMVRDIYGKAINLGVQPRLLFAGEESAGMTCGPEELIESKKGRKAIAMREKSDGEAIIIAAAMAAECESGGISLSDYLGRIFEAHKIKGRYDIRVENILYNESNPDPVGMRKEKEAGEIVRDKNDRFFIGIALARRENRISVAEAKQVLSEAFPKARFDNLVDVHFVGDGTYALFDNKYVEVRRSGTDAKIKAYSAGNSKRECVDFATLFAYYSGELTPSYRKLIGEDYIKDVQERGKKLYFDWANEGAPSGQS
jgi:phosphomannomutase